MQHFFNGKKVLITGHTGFKGAWLSFLLHQWGADVIGIALSPETTPNLFQVLGLEHMIKDYRCDIRDFNALQEIITREKPDIVFHLAAQALVRRSFRVPLETFAINTLGTAHVLEAIKDAKSVKAAVIITTDKVYENQEESRVFREIDPLGGYDPYSASKAAADIVASSYIRSYFNPEHYGKFHETRVGVARAGNVIGGGDWGEDRLVPDIVRAVYEGDGVATIRNPDSIRPWQHVFDCLDGYLRLAHALYEGKEESGGAWNFGSREEDALPVRQFAESAFRALGKGSYRVADVENNVFHEASVVRLDSSRAQSLLGWNSRMPVQDSIAHTFSWYQRYYENQAQICDYTCEQLNSFF
ncbi:MAG: CDP-glucose 4,6-dehydratase [Parcubacteria group bacterium Gr01-1014_33]|nr:MAG: CDP-glucose 4,6-dehydratase [Parcubacteria group bacterium Gr01-1014_33]